MFSYLSEQLGRRGSEFEVTKERYVGERELMHIGSCILVQGFPCVCILCASVYGC